jgi:hypothetical protein
MQAVCSLRKIVHFFLFLSTWTAVVIGISAGNWSAVHLDRSKDDEIIKPLRSKIVSTSRKTVPYEDRPHFGRPVPDKSYETAIFESGPCKCPVFEESSEPEAEIVVSGPRKRSRS